LAPSRRRRFPSDHSRCFWRFPLAESSQYRTRFVDEHLGPRIKGDPTAFLAVQGGIAFDRYRFGGSGGGSSLSGFAACRSFPISSQTFSIASSISGLHSGLHSCGTANAH
jgi:hypothetical protein